jgi:hypothetical protein
MPEPSHAFPFVHSLLPHALQNISLTAVSPLRLVLQGPRGSGKHMAMAKLLDDADFGFLTQHIDLRHEGKREAFERTLLQRGLANPGAQSSLCINGLECLSPACRRPLQEALEPSSSRPPLHFIALIRDALPLTGSPDEDALLHNLEPVNFVFPPLNQRLDELPLFLKALIRKDLQFDSGALQILRAWDWPGNMGELVAFAHRLRLQNVHEVRREHLPSELLKRTVEPRAIDLRQELLRHETHYIDWAMEVAGGNQSRAADLLGISRSSLHRRLQQAHNQHRPDKHLPSS